MHDELPRHSSESLFSRVTLAPSTIGRDALIGNPHPLRQLAGLPEHVDRNAAARIPIAADAQPSGLDLGHDSFADHDRAVLMEGAVIAEARDIELQGFGLQQPLTRYIVDHQMREIGLARYRAQRREFRRREPHQVIRIILRIGNAIEPGLFGRVGPFHGAAELQAGWYFARLLRHLDPDIARY